MKNDEDYMKTMKEKNEQLLNNHNENDEDFIEYELDPKSKFTLTKVGAGNFDFNKKEETGLVTLGFWQEPIEFNIDLRKPIVVGAFKLALTHTDEAPTKNEDDDAFLEVTIKFKWDIGNETNEIANFKID